MAGSLASGSLAAPTLGQLSSQARALANQSVAAQIAAVRSQQQQDLAQAQQRANSINAAALAASRYLQSLDLGGKAKADYQTAVGNQTGIASGYSGQLRSDADAAAKAAQASLASVPGNAQTVSDRGPSLANVLYGLGGALPATQLNTVEPAAVQAARALTASPLGYGQQEAYGALGAGAQAAQGLAGQIANARAQEPTLTQSYLAQLSQAVRDQALANSLIAQRGAPKVTTSGGGVYTVDPSTGKVTTAVSPPAPKPHIVSTGGGIYSVDPSTGATTTLKAPPKKSGAAAKQPSVAAQTYSNTTSGKALTLMTNAKSGFADQSTLPSYTSTTKGDPAGWSEQYSAGTKTYYVNHHPAISYAQAIQEGLKAGLPVGKVLKAANKLYGTPAQQARASARARRAQILNRSSTASGLLPAAG